MTFLIALIATVVEFSAVVLTPWRSGRWICTLHRKLVESLNLRHWIGGVSVLVSVAIPCALTVFVFAEIIGHRGFLAFLVGIAVLLYCCGPRSLSADIETYGRSYTDPDDRLPPDPDNLLLAVPAVEGGDDAAMRSVAVAAHDGIFAPVFWFVVLGPAGAILYRMTTGIAGCAMLDDAERSVAQRLQDVLAWLPARVLVFGFGLAGTLGPAWALIAARGFSLGHDRQLLGDAALATREREDAMLAEQSDSAHLRAVDAVYALVKRAFVVWLVVLALLAAAGWV